MATYNGTSINPSPTVTFPAAKEIPNAQGLAVALKEGKVDLPETRGENVLGLVLFTEEETIAEGEDVTVQVKDIGKWIVGEEIKAGDELTADTTGKAMKAAEGEFVTAVALSNATKDGSVVTAQIIKAGSKKN